MRRGSIVLVPFPFTDLSGQKVRPALVLYFSKKGEDIIVAFITSALRRRMGAFDILLIPSATNGLKIDSLVTLDKLATLQKKVALGEIGIMDPSMVKNIEKALGRLFLI